MASGPELMMNAILKAMGFDPRQFVASIQAFIDSVNIQLKHFTTSAQSINTRVEALQSEVTSLHEKIDFLIAMQTGKVIEHERGSADRNHVTTSGLNGHAIGGGTTDATSNGLGADQGSGGNLTA